MNSILKRIICFCFVLLLSLTCFVTVHADESEEGDEETVNVIDTFYVTTTQTNRSVTVPYNPNWFKADARVYDHDLAKLSLGLATAAFRPTIVDDFIYRPIDYNLNFFLYQCGFSDLRSDDYDKDPNRYTVSTVMGHRTVGEGDEAFELIAVGICGQGYLDEWESNFSIGNGDIHDGFSRSAQLVYDRIFGYIAAHHISGPIKIWISGFSRAAAVTNITAARLSDSSLFDQSTVFAYTFATPNTTREENVKEYDNIFNICGKMDPVTNVPFSDWGYTRYGKTFYTPVIETDSDYLKKREKADIIYKEITGINYWTNYDMNVQLRIIMGALLRICPDVETYANSLQNNLIALWEKHDPQSVLYRMLEMANDPLLINEENRQDANMFLNQIAGLGLDYLGSSNSFRRINEDASLGANILQAHTPELYLSWVFSVDDEKDLFTNTSKYRQAYIGGDVTVSLYMEDELLETLKQEETDKAKDLLYLSFSGDRISVLVPRDGNYRLEIRSDADQTINTLAADYEVGRQDPLDSEIKYYDMKKDEVLTVDFSDSGIIYSRASDYKEKSRIVDNGYYNNSRVAEFIYSDRADVTWRDVVLAIIGLSIIAISSILFVQAVLIMYLRFRHLRKKGFIPGKTPFRPLPILCSFLVFQFFLIKEFYSGLYDAQPNVINRYKIIIAVLVLIVSFYGYRRKKDLFHLLIMPATVVLSLADIAMTTSITAGALIYIADYILPCFNYIKAERPERSQIILWALLSAAGIWFVLRTQGSYGHLRIVAISYILSATALVITSFTHSGRIFRGSALLFVSGIMLILNNVNGTTFISHMIASGLHYIAMLTLAGAGSRFGRPRSMPQNVSEGIVEQG